MFFKKLSKIVSILAIASVLLVGCSGKKSSGVSAKQDGTNGKYGENKAQTEKVRAEAAPFAAGTYVNGERMSNYAALYTVSGGQEAVATTIAVSDSLVLVVAAGIDSDLCRSGAEFSLADLKGSSYVDFLIIDVSGYYEYNSRDNADMFSDASVRINAFSSGVYAEYSIKLKGAFNGKEYDIETSERADYIEPEVQAASSSNAGCYYCGGTGICHVCNGLGYTRWGGTQTDCSSCDKNRPGKCYYCEGTGTQIWQMRGVRK